MKRQHIPPLYTPAKFPSKLHVRLFNRIDEKKERRIHSIKRTKRYVVVLVTITRCL